MSPRLRFRRAAWIGGAKGGLTALSRLGPDRIAATIAFDPGEADVARLLQRIAEWEAKALARARRDRRRGAQELRAAAPRLRGRPSLPGRRPSLRLSGPVSALDAALSPDAGPWSEAVRVVFAASPVILPAAGLVTLEFRLLRLARFRPLQN